MTTSQIKTLGLIFLSLALLVVIVIFASQVSERPFLFAQERAITQSAYRFFDNTNSTNVGSPLAAQNTAISAPQGMPFRLHLLLHIDNAALPTGGEIFKLQFAQKSGTCDTSFAGENYVDLSPTSRTIRFYDNPAVSDGTIVSVNTSDPVHGADILVPQTYEEANTFTAVPAVAPGRDGLWDFALVNDSAPANTPYCFRVVKADGTLLDAYSVLPEIITSAVIAEVIPAAGAAIAESIERRRLGLLPEQQEQPIPQPTAPVNPALQNLLDEIQEAKDKKDIEVPVGKTEADTAIINDALINTAVIENLAIEGIAKFGKNSVLFASDTIAFTTTTATSTLVFGGGADSVFEFRDATGVGDLFGNNTLIQIVDQGTSGSLTVTGGAIFNDSQDASQDFIIRSNTEPTLFFVDSSANTINIGSTASNPLINVIGRGMSFSRFNPLSSRAPFISFRRARGTPAAPLAVAIGDFTAKFDFQGYDGSSNIEAARFSAVVDGPVVDGLGVPGAGRVPSAFTIETGDSGTHPERFRITSQGLVGIGTSFPRAKLHVVNGVIRVDGGGGGSGVIMTPGDGTAGWFVWGADSGNFYIHNMTNGLNLVTVQPNGNVGIGTTFPAQRLTVNGNASKIGGGSWAVFSDDRLKTITGSFELGLNEILKLNPVRYHYNSDNSLEIVDEGEHIGLSAQAVQKIIPEAVFENDKGYLMIENDPIIWTMLNAIKELNVENQDLNQRLQRLEDGNTASP